MKELTAPAGWGFAAGALSSWAASWVAVLLTATAVKLVDAIVDEEPGVRPGASASWIALLLAGAAGLNPALSASLATAAWVVGMMALPGRARIGFGPLRAEWLEALAVAALASLVLHPFEVCASTLAVGSVQAVDDWLDGDGQPADGSRPWAQERLLLLAAALWALAAVTDARRLFLVTSAVPVAQALAGRLQGRGGLLGDPPEAPALRWGG